MKRKLNFHGITFLLIFILQQLLFFTLTLETDNSSKDSLENEVICQFLDLLEEENDFESDLYENTFEEEKKLFGSVSINSLTMIEKPMSRLFLFQSKLFKTEIYSPPDISI